MVSSYGDGTFVIGTLQGDLIKKPINGYQQRPYHGGKKMHAFPFPDEIPIMRDPMVAYVLITYSGNMETAKRGQENI